jgi:hypothetical protein
MRLNGLNLQKNSKKQTGGFRFFSTGYKPKKTTPKQQIPLSPQARRNDTLPRNVKESQGAAAPPPDSPLFDERVVIPKECSD